MASVQAEINDLVINLRAANWRVRGAGSHRVAYPPEGTLTPVTISGTPGNRGRWRRHLAADLRKRGFEWRPRPPQKKRIALNPHATVTAAAITRAQETPMVAQPAFSASPPASAAADDIVDVRPAPIGLGDRVTQKVMEIVYGDGRIRYHCADHTDIEADSVRKIFRHRRDDHVKPKPATVRVGPKRVPLQHQGVGWTADRIESWLREQVVDGKWAPGTDVPSSYVLASRFSCSRKRIDDAYIRLTGEGLFTMPSRRAGRFVANPLPKGNRRTTKPPVETTVTEPVTESEEYQPLTVAEEAAVAEPEPEPQSGDVLDEARKILSVI